MKLEGWKQNIVYIVFIGIICVLLFMNGDSKNSIVFSDSQGFLVQQASDVQEDVWMQTFLLEKGDYHFTFFYTASDDGNEILTYADGLERTRTSIEKGGESITIDVHLKESCSAFKIVVHYAGAGYLELRSVECATDQPWHRDNWLKIGLFLLIAIWLVVIRYMYVQKKTSEQTILGISIVFGLTLLASTFTFSGNKIGYGDDLQYHLTRIEGIADGLRKGQFPVMIYPKALYGNGYLNAMYPSLFLYIPACLRLLGVSFVSAYKVLLFIINCLTAFIMYGSVKSLYNSEKVCVLATGIYLFSRYRLNNMLVRGALGETLAMVFVPLIIVGLYHLIVGNRRKYWMLVVGATGIIQSHVLSTIIYAVICLIMVCVFAKKIIEEKRYIELFKCIVYVVLLNIGFIVPFLYYYLKGNLNLRVATQAYDMASGGLNPSYIFGVFDIFKNEYMNHDFALHLAIICLLCISIWYLFITCNSKTEEYKFYKYATVMAIFMLFMATNWFPYDKLNFMNVFQFPWRFLGPAICIITIIGSICLVQLEKSVPGIKCLVLLLIAIQVWDTSNWSLNWNDNMRGSEERESSAEYRDSDMDKTNADILYWAEEYVIQGAGEYMHTYSVTDYVDVQQYSKDGLNITADYTVLNESEQWMDIPLQNYKGYRVMDESGKRYDIVTGPNGNIRIRLISDGKTHSIHVFYKEPFMFRIAEIISLVTYVFIFYYLFKKQKGVKNGIGNRLF